MEGAKLSSLCEHDSPILGAKMRVLADDFPFKHPPSNNLEANRRVLADYCPFRAGGCPLT